MRLLPDADVVADLQERRQVLSGAPRIERACHLPSVGRLDPVRGKRDQQVGKIVEAIELGPRWEEEVLSIVSTRDEAESIRDKRQKVQERLRRLGKAYVDGVYDDEEYKRQEKDG